MNIAQASATPGPLGWTPTLRARPARSRWTWVVPPLVLLLFAAIGAVFVQLPYYEIAPGTARSVDDLVHVADGHAYPPKGKVLLTTVSLGQVRNVYDAIGAWLDSDVEVVPERDILPPKTDRQQYERQNLQDMTDSKEIAEYVAFRQLGYDVKVQGEGGLILDVERAYPAAAVLNPGDVVVAVDDRPVTLSDDLVQVIQHHKAGDAVRLRVKADAGAGPERDVTTTLGRRDDGTPILGVRLQTFRQRFTFPFQVDIDSGQIGGPSAGLAFTLALLDVLTPGELTGGVPVAATGTISPEGRVGEVGGVAQKTVAVKRAGAKLFIVPSGEYAVAKAHAGRGLRVEKADTLDEALKILATLPGSNALALGRPGQGA